jgi:transposase
VARVFGHRTCTRFSLSPYSPELHPAEPIFRHIRKHLSNTVFTTLDELQNALIEELEQFWEQPTVLLSLTGYPWWVEAVKTNISSNS